MTTQTGVNNEFLNDVTVTNTTFSTIFDTNVEAAGVTLSGTTISADGTDANIAIVMTPKGTSLVQLTGLTPNSVALVTTSAGITDSGALTSGQIVVGSTGAIPIATSLTGGTHLLVTEGAGTLDIDLTSNVDMTAVHGWNGAVLETVDLTVTSDGATITLSVQKSGGGNLTLVFSDEFTTFVAAPATIALTAGSDTSPQINYIYIPQSTKALTKSTTAFPSAEHVPLATVLCQSAASLQTKKAYKVHVWTDHLVNTNNQGHVSHLNHWIRTQNATWMDGVVQTYTITPNGGAVDNVILTTTSGTVLQLHDHTFPAFAGTPDIYVVNDSVTPYTIVTDLSSLLTDSTGASMSGRYFTLVIWGVVSEATTDCKLFVNLPSGSYNKVSDVTADTSKFANFTIPSEFKATAFLISQWNLRHQVSASGTWTSIDEVDLRGLFPGTSAGSGTASATEFPDNTFKIFDEGDSTKEIAFQASGITAATTRTLTVQDQDGTIALLSDFGAPPAIGDVTPNTGAFSTVDIDGGNIDNTFIGLVTPNIGAFTTVNVITSLPAAGMSIDNTAGGGGDPIFKYQVGGVARFVMGIDAADSEKFKIGTAAIGTSTILTIDSSQQVGFGVTDPDTRVEILNAGNQLKLSFDGTDNATFGVDTNGDLTITPSGSDVRIVGVVSSGLTIGGGAAIDAKLVFNGNAQDFYVGLDDTDDFLHIGLGAVVGTTPYVTVDTSGRIGIGVTDPDTKLEILNGGAQLKLSYNGSNNCVSTVNSDGNITHTLTGNTASGFTLVGGIDCALNIETNAVDLNNELRLNFVDSSGLERGRISHDLDDDKMVFTKATNFRFTDSVEIRGTAAPPVLTIGDSGVEDVTIVFDGNSENYYMGLDDTDDFLKIGSGKIVGTTPYVTVDTSGHVGIGTDAPISFLHVDAYNTAFDDTNGLAVFQDDTNRQIVVGGLGLFRRDSDTDNADLRMNYIGYQGGATRFRDFAIYNGKNTVLLFVDASQGEVQIQDTLVIQGNSPTITIGDAGTEDTKLVFGGNAQNYYVGLDDTDDFLKIGRGSTVGTTPTITIDTSEHVGIGTETPATSALLELSSTTGALLVPRMTGTQRDALTAVNGMIVYRTDTNNLQVYQSGSWLSIGTV